MKYKIPTFAFALCLLLARESKSQAIIVTSANSLVVKKGAILSLGGLALTPTPDDFTFNENGVFISTVPLVGNPNESIARIYNFYDVVTFTGIITMKYLPSELNGNVDTDLQLAFAGSDVKFGVPSNYSNSNSNTHTLTESVTDKTFQYITATSSGSALPVKLINFTTMATENNVLIAWCTSEETNSDYFEVQHSVDGQEWEAIGQVKATGVSDVEKTYSYEHSEPVTGDNFYRLKMVDLDGTFTYSRLRTVKYGGFGSIALHPNPVTDWLRISATDWSAFTHIKITNVAGDTVNELNEEQIKNLPEKAINVRMLPSGIYLVHMTLRDGTLNIGKVYKN